MDNRPPRPSTYLRQFSLEYPYKDLVNATQSWAASRQLGSGSYGAVYKGELEDGSIVAIKALNLAALGQQSETAGFEDEVLMLSKFRHPNLVTLLGWGKKDYYRYLVYELLQGGDAFQRLAKAKMPPPNGKQFMWHERLSVCLDAATGLSHMHNSKPKAFHRDIKSANILLDRHGTAKMADFGLSCTAKSSHASDLHVTVKTISGTPGYACPIYSKTGRVTEGSEVYSFGMVMLELMTNHAPATADPRKPGGIAYPIRETVDPERHGAEQRAMDYLDLTAQWPEPLARELSQLALKCVTKNDESLRPPFISIVRALRSMTERFPVPSGPPQAMPPSFSSQLPQVPAHMMSAQAGVAAAAAAVGGARTPQGQPKQPVAFVPQQQQQPQQQQSRAGGSSPQVRTPTAAESNRSCPGARPVAAPPQQQSQAIYALQLEKADALSIATLPVEQRRLPITPSLGEGGLFTFPVGRHHQQDLFEAWLPSDAMRNCISRTAFEVTMTQTGDNVQLVAKGANPIAVDGTQAFVNRGVPLRIGSVVAFTHPSMEDILTLRFARIGQPLPALPAGQPAAPAPSPAIAAAVAAASASAAAAAPVAGSGASTSSSWRVECVYAEGYSATTLQSLPAEQRILSIREGSGSVHIGRQHQAAFFEALLRNSQKCLAFISRTHAEMEVVPRRGLNVTNLSGNPLWIDGELLGKNKSALVVQDQVISFARLETSRQDSPEQHVHFLRLQVRSGEASLPASAFLSDAAARSPARLEPEVSASSGAPFRPQPRGDATPQAAGQATPSAASNAFASSNRSPAPLDENPRPQPKAKARPGQATSASESNGVVLLELGGAGVNSDLPTSQLRLGPISIVSEPLIIGRRHQREMHQNCIQDKDCLQFVSRDHLEISLVGSEFRLKALTANPIWRERAGTEPYELAQNDTVCLDFGDRILLGTGNTDGGETTSKKLHWLFLRPGTPETRRASGHPENDGGRTPPSPGGHGPRIAEHPPSWARSATADAGGWEPMLPPAAETVQHRGRGFEDRPSEAHGPAPRLLPDDDDDTFVPGSGGLPQFGGGAGGAAGRSGGMLRPPVALDDVPEASGW
mmetsp:Transcript_20034/g.36167  ORF Transcript_20034/g.36167 Transcript_20034/m.36167 type:complete len:1088 (-) Transcript_20034:148-3411(-)